jgi:hypothetical protein
MKKTLALSGASLGWLAILTQYYLSCQNPDLSIGESSIRFFSFFTILTNILVAVYFTIQVTAKKTKLWRVSNQAGTLTAVTVYILVVGLVYQTVLRQIWHPKGLQMLVNETLHGLIPLLTIVFWYLYENKSAIKWATVPKWLAYPLIYLAYVLIHGSLSGFYPYPFVNVLKLGYPKVLLNSAFLTIVFIAISVAFVGLGKFLEARKSKKQTMK